MATKLNDSTYQHAQDLIKQDEYVLDRRDDWRDHRPTSGKENCFIQEKWMKRISENGIWE